jgi:uncharacterized oligopeptide transporter (OPT) family protein
MLRITLVGYLINLAIVVFTLIAAWSLGLPEGWIWAAAIVASVLGWEACARQLRRQS